MKKLSLMVACSLLFFACNNPTSEAPATPESTVTPSPEAAPQAAAFADAKFADIGKKGLASLSAGDVDAWMASFADTAVYRWNSGDSLKGKEAITKYWKQRRGEVIDSITFNNQIWLPITVNQPQATESAGTWLLSWYLVDAKYKNGKRMRQWIHTDLHFNSADQIDQVIQYLDRVPINQAIGK